jgi:pimeloyl-ACP methyl ester carboxylesterase
MVGFIQASSTQAKFKNWPLVGLLGCCWLALAGCVTELASELIIAPTNGGLAAVPRDLEHSPFLDERGSVVVGPPYADMLYWVVEPKQVQVWTVPRGEPGPQPPDDGQWNTVEFFTGKARGPGWLTGIRYRRPGSAGALASRKQPRGTIIILQGYDGHVRRYHYLWPIAAVLADAGYRVILPDLRGQGDSTGNVLGYGVFESRDISQLIDDLQTKNLLAGKVGIFGHSYGAAVAIGAAAVDHRIAAVISAAPPQSMRDCLPYSVRTAAQRDHALLNFFIGWILTDDFLQKAINRAGEIAGFDPDQASPLLAINHTTTPILLMHGDRDKNVPLSHSQTLYQARPDHTELVIYEGEDHWSYLDRRAPDFQQRCVAWFDRWLTPTTQTP